MDKEDLMNVVYDHNKYLLDMLEEITKEISYNKDLLLLNEKHKRNNYDTKNEIEKLNLKQAIVQEIIDDFTETIENNDVDIKEIEKEIK